MNSRRYLLYLASLLMGGAVMVFISTMALADVYETFSGSTSFKLTITDRNQTTGKLVKTIQNINGTVEVYIIPNGGPTQGPGGYYMRFFDSQSGLTAGITSLEIVNTEILSSKSQKILGVGAGVFIQNDIAVGPAIVSITGSMAVDAVGNPISITGNLAISGGGPSNGPNGKEYVWTGKPKVILLPGTPLP